MKRLAASARLAPAIALFAAVALSACAPSGHTPVALEETTSAIVAGQRTVPPPPPPTILVEETPPLRIASVDVLDEAFLSQASGAALAPPTPSEQSAYDRIPRHEPDGATYGDVGVPYPLPSLPNDWESLSSPPASSPRATSAAPPPIPESSFSESARPSEPVAPDAIPESSFAPSR